MEPIEIALEKAKIARQDNQVQEFRGSVSHAGSDIEYTQTRTVKVSKLALRESRVISGFDNGPWVNQFRMLRTRVLHSMDEQNWSTLAVTSAEGGVGKGLIATNLAISLAMELDSTVLLVDANIQDPKIHKLFDFEPKYGLSDYLSGRHNLSELLFHPNIERLVVLPAGEPLQNSTELLGSKKMEQLVRELKKRYPSRIVIFDLPPVLTQSDALAFSPYVDAALFVVEEGKSQMDSVKRAVSLLSKTKLLGVVVNKTQINRINYS